MKLEHVAYGVLAVGGVLLAAEFVAGFQAKSLSGALPSWFTSTVGKVENVSPGPLGAGGNLVVIGAGLLLLDRYVL